MKKVIDTNSKEDVVFGVNDLPMFIHGVEHSGASLFSITVLALFHRSGSKLLVFTAYPMAKAEFIEQTGDAESVFYLEDEQNLAEALKFQTIFIQSGNADLFAKVIAHKELLGDRVVFIKNIETINVSIVDIVKDYKFIVSGDLGSNSMQGGFTQMLYNTKIFLSPLAGEDVPALEKYQAYMHSTHGQQILSISA